MSRYYIPFGYDNINNAFFSDENITKIQRAISDIFKSEYRQTVLVPKEDILRIMSHHYDDREESLDKLNLRVIYDISSEIRNEYAKFDVHNYWDKTFWSAYNHDPSLGHIPFERPRINEKYKGFQFYYTR